MSTYSAPLDEMMFVIEELAGLAAVNRLPGLEEATSDLVAAVLEEAGKVGRDVLDPISQVGDREGCVLENGVVRTPSGFKEAYRQYVDGGWNAIPFETEFGGQGLPWVVATAVSEIWNSANMGFALNPMLNLGAAELLIAHGSEEQKAKYLPNMVSGDWPGTMNLTEPQAGSDLGALRSKAVRDGDHYRITGQKIFISYGEHDLTENIIHLVLARLPDAPAGSRGISLFVVPKFLVNDDGSLGERNDLRCVSIEHKMGIHASPTAVMSFGDDGGAIGYLVGKENEGLKYMFTMMNNARLGVGLQGIAVAERAYQRALAYAKERVQSRALTGSDPSPVSIIHHPDVRRMLLAMKSQTEAARALSYYTTACLDIAKRHTDPDVRHEKNAIVELLTPVVKAWGSEVGFDVASLGVQVHGGMGYIEETGAAQHLRDARITAIYEGTNGIQAQDLIGRKVARDNGASMTRFIATVRDLDRELAGLDGENLPVIRERLRSATLALAEATDWLLETWPTNPALPSAGALHYLHLTAMVAGGWMLAKAALVARRKLDAGEGNADFLRGKVLSARFFADHFMTQAPAMQAAFVGGGKTVLDIEVDQF